ncbi:MAG TPA: hypothetical protein VGN93_23025 [Shinella sp.]|jgi:hypothetical protein|uniref:hypothetical protein n=1 Tax=Shinella sp. TaxID=1870904 RepID=UPI002E156DA2|nr:hypothetical protein [Shinella sp.]
MTDIRKHGFESDAQWREYLAEIEEAAGGSRPGASRQDSALRALAALSAEVAGLRERVGARLRLQARSRRRWLGLCLLAAALTAAYRWRATNRFG